MNVETLLPILASTLRDIFVILGVILIFQMIVLAYLKRHHLHGGKVIYTKGRLNQLGTVYFGVLLVFFQIELLTGKPTWIIVTERLMLLCHGLFGGSQFGGHCRCRWLDTVGFDRI